MINYSQNSEQEVVLKYFNGFVGTFIDIGANDGKTLSNTHAMALNGWKGVCIEPTFTAFSKLQTLYIDNPNVVCIKAAIGDADKTVSISVNGSHLSDADSGLLSTVIESEKKRWVGEDWSKEVVNMITYKTLIKMLNSNKSTKGINFDFISIDAEGCDFDILQQIDLTHTKALCIEHNSVPEIAKKIDVFCKTKGLVLIYKNAENLIYARRFK